ncbi:MAG: aminodeoxychorismate synthase component I [Acidobacteria bacterium]|nr:MAG: aminodeoxychorismate synthase component I [Acidobacteriota bacterium]
MSGFPGHRDFVLIYDATTCRWLRFSHPIGTYVAHTPDAVLPCLHQVAQHVESGAGWAAGFVAYEAAPAFDPALTVRVSTPFPCLWFGIYTAPEEILPVFNRAEMPDIQWKTSVPADEYRGAVRRIKEHIAAGDTYQVNYTFRLHGPFNADPWNLFSRMIRPHQPGYGAYIDVGRWVICSASPELFWAREGDLLWSRPMKGTAARGLLLSDDVALGDWLQDSEKNQAENLMIVDMVRNDLGRIARQGSVTVSRLFQLEKHPTVWQMTSTVECRTAAPLPDVFRALFPPASITGAPKVNTMDIISRLETTPRGIYTGTVGFLAPDNRAQFNVAIRTVLIDREEKSAEYGIGSGVVWDSEESLELDECLLKAKALTQAPADFQLLETVLWTPEEGYFLIDRHLRRLYDSAQYFSYPIDLEAIRSGLTSQAFTSGSHPQKVRILVASSGEAIIENKPLEPHGEEVTVCLSRTPVDSRDPFLYHKTTHRAVYEQARQSLPGFEDVLLWNERGEITESTVANIVVEMQGARFTPPVSSGLLPGTYRSLLLEEGQVAEKVIRPQDLKNCSSLYLINSVRRTRRAAYIDD